jgi:hypothetical protein
MESLIRLLAAKLMDWVYHQQGVSPRRGELPNLPSSWQLVPYPPVSRWSHWKAVCLDPPSRVFVDPFTKTPLYLGSSFNAADFTWLKQRNVWHVVNVSQSIPNLHVGVKYYRVSVRDVAGARLFFNAGHAYEAIQFIHEQLCNKRPVFVHCWAGSSRSASVVLLYLLWRRHFSNLIEAYDALSRQRKMVAVNRDFLNVLEGYVKTLHLYTHQLTTTTTTKQHNNHGAACKEEATKNNKPEKRDGLLHHDQFP